MKVINCTRTDWANFSYDNAMALRSVGIDAESVCMVQHSFNYLEASQVYDKDYIKHMMLEADIVQIIHSCVHSLNLYISSGTKAKLIVYHTGSIYRNDPNIFNKLFANAALHITDQCEFMLIGNNRNKLKYLATCINTNIYTRKNNISNPICFAHYPSSIENKGTDTIIRIINSLKNTPQIKDKFSFALSTEIVSHKEQLARMGECDVYIELFKPELNRKPYGCFGVTAFEAAAMGKIVITQNINPDAYFNEYGECKFQLAKNEEHLKEIIITLANSTSKEISNLQEETREWVVKNHSYKATGQRIVEKILA